MSSAQFEQLRLLVIGTMEATQIALEVSQAAIKGMQSLNLETTRQIADLKAECAATDMKFVALSAISGMLLAEISANNPVPSEKLRIMANHMKAWMIGLMAERRLQGDEPSMKIFTDMADYVYGFAHHPLVKS